MSKYYICIISFNTDKQLNKFGLSRLAVCTDAERNNPLLAALHFLQEERSLKEVMLEVKQQYELESVLQKKLPLFPLFEDVKSSEDVLNIGLWQLLQKEIGSLASDASDAMFESIARCNKRQISLLYISNLRKLLPEVNIFGKQVDPETMLCIVGFVHFLKLLPFAVTATQIHK